MPQDREYPTPHYVIRAALQTFTAESRRQNFDSLTKEEQFELLIEAAAHLATYAEEIGLPGRHIARAAEFAVDPSALDDMVIPKNMRNFTDYAPRRRDPGGRGA